LRVRQSTRERVNALGARTHASADAVVTRALSLYEEELFWADYDRAIAETTDEERAEDRDEMAVWDTALADGLHDQ